MKALSLVAGLAGMGVLLIWWKTGIRPSDWYIAVIILLNAINELSKFFIKDYL